MYICAFPLISRFRSNPSRISIYVGLIKFSSRNETLPAIISRGKHPIEIELEHETEQFYSMPDPMPCSILIFLGRG